MTIAIPSAAIAESAVDGCLLAESSQGKAGTAAYADGYRTPAGCDTAEASCHIAPQFRKYGVCVCLEKAGDLHRGRNRNNKAVVDGDDHTRSFGCQAGVKMRRRAWNDREVTLEPAGWPGFADPGSSPHHDAQMAELLSAVGAAIAQDLTPHQREVLVAVTLDDVPIDVLAERLQTTRGALYKTLHDARRRLRACLAARGLDPDLQDRDPSP